MLALGWSGAGTWAGSSTVLHRLWAWLGWLGARTRLLSLHHILSLPYHYHIINRSFIDKIIL